MQPQKDIEQDDCLNAYSELPKVHENKNASDKPHDSDVPDTKKTSHLQVLSADSEIQMNSKLDGETKKIVLVISDEKGMKFQFHIKPHQKLKKLVLLNE